MNALKRKVIKDLAPNWSLDPTGVLICPCGCRVEDDGTCPEGHKSPLLKAGMI